MNDHSQKLRNLIDSMNLQGRFGVELDLANPIASACVAAQMGGEDAMRERYPVLYNSYQEARERPADLLQDPRPTGFCNMATVLDVGYSQAQGCACAVGNMTLTSPARRMCLTLDIYAEDKLIAHNMEIYSYCPAGEIEALSQAMRPLEKGKTYKAYLQATWEPMELHGLRSMVAQAEGAGTAEDVIDTVELTDPRHICTQADEPITVAYARNATKLIDYSYSETRDPRTGDEKVKLDVTGKAFFKSGYVLSDVEINNSGAALHCIGLGDIMYLGELKFGDSKDNGTFFPVAEGDKHGIGWALNTDWSNTIQQSVKAGNRLYDFELSINFRCKEDESLHHLLVTSASTQLILHQNHCKQVSPVRLYWGCLAGDTKVVMANGEEKPISQLQEDDYILDGEGGGSRKITHIINGPDDEVYVLRTLDGHEIRASIGHPFLTNEGFKAVRDLHCELSIRLKDGSLSPIIYCYPEHQRVPVYNLELEDGRSFYANGMVSGTNLVQGDLLKQAHELEAALKPDPEIEAETRKMQADRLAGLL